MSLILTILNNIKLATNVIIHMEELTIMSANILPTSKCPRSIKKNKILPNETGIINDWKILHELSFRIRLLK